MSGQRRGPLIGVTGPATRLAWGRIAACHAVRRGGGVAIALRPGDRPLPRNLDGLIVTGGSDIDPALYLTAGGPWVAADPVRDQFEMAALNLAQRQGWPVLGICRGAQLINVVAGGTLHTDITEMRQVTSNRPSLRAVKAVDIDPGSRLARVTRKTTLHVNSLHHQAVRDVGKGLVVVARDRDGIVQAIEASGERFCVGVQWHPEYLPLRRSQRRLFRALIDAARR